VITQVLPRQVKPARGEFLVNLVDRQHLGDERGRPLLPREER
jgi:hypothetical protein